MLLSNEDLCIKIKKLLALCIPFTNSERRELFSPKEWATMFFHNKSEGY